MKPFIKLNEKKWVNPSTGVVIEDLGAESGLCLIQPTNGNRQQYFGDERLAMLRWLQVNSDDMTQPKVKEGDAVQIVRAGDPFNYETGVVSTVGDGFVYVHFNDGFNSGRYTENDLNVLKKKPEAQPEPTQFAGRGSERYYVWCDLVRIELRHLYGDTAAACSYSLMEAEWSDEYDVNPEKAAHIIASKQGWKPLNSVRTPVKGLTTGDLVFVSDQAVSIFNKRGEIKSANTSGECAILFQDGTIVQIHESHLDLVIPF